MRFLIDRLVLLAVDLFAYLRHPVWIARTAVRQRRLPRIAVPRQLREKRIWRLMFDDNPLFPILADKITAKAWMLRTSPDLAAARILWAGADPRQMPDAALRGGVVLKTNHGCNFNIFLPAPPKDRTAVERQLQRWLDTPYGERDGIRCWRHLERKAFSEELLAGADGAPLIDFNLFCCDGVVAFAVATTDEKKASERVAYFDADGNRMLSIMHDPSYPRDWLPTDFALPPAYHQAVRTASRLSRGIDFVRVDLMCVDDRLYACEMTLFPGVGAYTQTALFRDWAKSWDLRKSWFVRTPQRGWAGVYRGALARRLAVARSGPGSGPGGVARDAETDSPELVSGSTHKQATGGWSIGGC